MIFGDAQADAWVMARIASLRQRQANSEVTTQAVDVLRWRASVLQAWDRQCASCGSDGQIGGATIGVDAAHGRWFAFDGPDSVDNGLALCTLHHKLFDLGAVGLTASLGPSRGQGLDARGRSYEVPGQRPFRGALAASL